MSAINNLTPEEDRYKWIIVNSNKEEVNVQTPMIYYMKGALMMEYSFTQIVAETHKYIMALADTRGEYRNINWKNIFKNMESSLKESHPSAYKHMLDYGKSIEEMSAYAAFIYIEYSDKENKTLEDEALMVLMKAYEKLFITSPDPTEILIGSME